jgi:hypothetical protein
VESPYFSESELCGAVTVFFEVSRYSAGLQAGRSGFQGSIPGGGSGAHPASYPMGTRGSFPRGKSGRGVKLTTHLHLVPRSKNAWSYTSTPQYAFMAWCLVKHRDNFTFTFTFTLPPLVSDTLLTTLHPLLENVLQTVDHFEISCVRAPFSWLEKPRNRMGRDLN